VREKGIDESETGRERDEREKGFDIAGLRKASESESSVSVVESKTIRIISSKHPEILARRVCKNESAHSCSCRPVCTCVGV